MKAHTNQVDLGNAQVIRGMDGVPEFVVLPVAEYLSLKNKKINMDDGVPNQVVNMVFDNDWTPIRAWREHLGLTQEEMAQRLGVSQPTYSSQESSTKTRKATREKIAAALGIKPAQLDF